MSQAIGYRIEVKGAKELMPMDPNGQSDPYSKMGLANPSTLEFLDPSQVVRSKVLNMQTHFVTLTPIWKGFYMIAKSTEYKIRVEVWDKDQDVDDDFEGMAIIDLDKLEGDEQELWLPLVGRTEDEKVTGEINIKFNKGPINELEAMASSRSSSSFTLFPAIPKDDENKEVQKLTRDLKTQSSKLDLMKESNAKLDQHVVKLRGQVDHLQAELSRKNMEMENQSGDLEKAKLYATELQKALQDKQNVSQVVKDWNDKNKSEISKLQADLKAKFAQHKPDSQATQCGTFKVEVEQEEQTLSLDKIMEQWKEYSVLVDSLENEINAKNEKIKQIQEEREESVRVQLQEKEREVHEVVQQQLDDAEKRREEAEKKLEEVENKRAEAEKRREEAEKLRAEAEEAKEEAEKQFVELLKLEMGDQKEEEPGNNGEVDKLHFMIKEATEKLESVQKKLHHESKLREELEAALRKKEEEATKRRIEEQQTIETLHKQVQEKSSEVQHLQLLKVDLESQHQTEIQTLTLQVNNQKGEQEKQSEAKEEKEREIERLRQELQAKAQEIERYASEQKDLVLRNDLLLEDKTSLEKKVAQLSQTPSKPSFILSGNGYEDEGELMVTKKHAPQQEHEREEHAIGGGQFATKTSKEDAEVNVTVKSKEKERLLEVNLKDLELDDERPKEGEPLPELPRSHPPASASSKRRSCFSFGSK